MPCNVVPALLALVSGIAAAEVTTTVRFYDFQIAHRPGYPVDGIGLARYQAEVCQALGYEGQIGFAMPEFVTGGATYAFVDADGLWQHTTEAQRVYAEVSCFVTEKTKAEDAFTQYGSHAIAHRPGFPVDGFGIDMYLNDVCTALGYEGHNGISRPQRVTGAATHAFVSEDGRWQKTTAALYAYYAVKCFKTVERRAIRAVTLYRVPIAHRPGYPADGLGLSAYQNAVCEALGFESASGVSSPAEVVAGDATHAFLNKLGQWEVTRGADRVYEGIACSAPAAQQVFTSYGGLPIVHGPHYPADGIGTKLYLTDLCNALGFSSYDPSAVFRSSPFTGTGAYVTASLVWQKTADGASYVYTSVTCTN